MNRAPGARSEGGHRGLTESRQIGRLETSWLCETEAADKLHEVWPAGNGVAQRDTCAAQPAQQHIPGRARSREIRRNMSAVSTSSLQSARTTRCMSRGSLRDAYGFWELRSLCGRLPVTIRRTALGGTASETPEGSKPDEIIEPAWKFVKLHRRRGPTIYPRFWQNAHPKCP